LGLVLVAAMMPIVVMVGSAQPAQRGQVSVLPVQGNVYLAASASANAAFSVGEDGVLVVDTMPEPLADLLVAAIRQVAGAKPLRYIVNTHVHADHTGGNVKIAAAEADAPFIWAHENVLTRMSTPPEGQAPVPFAAWPTDAFFTPDKEVYFNGEAVQVLHQAAAHTDGDTIVFFRKSDVVVAGDVFVTTTFPVINLEQGGSLNGTIDALNRIIDLTIPKEQQEGGTYVIPGHGRLTDEADVVEYRDMLTVVRDRFQDAITEGMTLEQVKAARLVRDYEGRYGASSGAWTTNAFVEAAYRSLAGPAPKPGRTR
jgi:glyoxylase-like metal-dependent hydrolase (beta-lactamase superfamily II)